MPETKAARNARLKAMRKKHGLGEFQGRKRAVKNRVVSMAKRRHSHSRSGSSGSLSAGKVIVGGLIYGAVRNKINGFVKGLTGNVALNLSDEMAMGLVDWLIAKKSSGIIKQAALVGLGIEASRLGSSFNVSGSILGTSSAVSTSSNEFLLA